MDNIIFFAVGVLFGVLLHRLTKLKSEYRKPIPYERINVKIRD